MTSSPARWRAESDAPTLPRSVARVRTLAALLLLWAVAWAQDPGKIVADTKIDLALDPWDLMARALHLWDDGSTFGILQNQGYGYLFPMGPFAALGQLVAPAWVVQRVWWAVLLTVGYLAMRRLLRELGVTSDLARHVAALAFALSPRVVSTLGPISSEAAPALLAPAIVLPLVLAANGRLGARRAGALSALAVLCCGGVNATATVLAVVPAGLWLLTRRRWWRASLTWWWAATCAAAVAWWAVPLVVLGRYSPPFLDWIETSDTVTRNVSLLDDLRGTSHWLGHLVTQAGPWWSAGFDLVAMPYLVVATTVTAAAGLAGLTLRRVPERGWLVTTALVGLLALALPHAGVLDSPLTGQVQAALDGALSPLRNVHKADPVLRLPFTVGLAVLLARLLERHAALPRRLPGRARFVVAAVVVLAALAPALPGLAGRLPPNGSFGEVSRDWQQAGAWLDDHAGEGVALVVPASNFDEYTWGRPLDQVLRTQTVASTAVRDAVPLTPANTVRLLDSVETRLQSGRGLGGATAVLRAAGVRFLVLRNDLATDVTGGVPVPVARESLTVTEDVPLARGFGSSFVNAYGDRVQPVEIYRLGAASTSSSPGTVGRRAPATLTPLSAVMSATGAGENLADLAEAGLGAGPVIFDGDRTGVDVAGGLRVVTDGFRARSRGFGSVRGRDVSSTLSAAEAGDARDYLPWADQRLRTTVRYDGLTALAATTSLARDATSGGLDPATRPYAAVDGLSTTAWVAELGDAPALTMTFDRPRSVAGLQVAPLADRDLYGDLLGIPTRLRITTDAGTVAARVGASGRLQGVTGLPTTPTTRLRIEVAGTDQDGSAVVTGISEVRVPGLVVRESVVVPDAGAAAVDTYVLTEQLRGQDGCIAVRSAYRCREQPRSPEEPAGLDRSLPVPVAGGYTVRGTLAPVSGTAIDAVLDRNPVATVDASSRLWRAPQARPGAVVDGDESTAWSPSPSDARPTLRLTYPSPVDVRGLRLVTRGEWSTGRTATAEVTVDGRRQLSEVGPGGAIDVRPDRGRVVSLRLLLGATAVDARRDTSPSSGLEVAELVVDGAPTASAPAALDVACGAGPHLLVDGVQFPTRVTGPRAAAYGAGALTYETCGSVPLGRDRARVVVEPWAGFVADQAILSREGSAAAATGSSAPLDLTRRSSGSLDGELVAGPRTLLRLGQNANAGWQASVDGRRLDVVTVGGWEQGFVVPTGVAGHLEVRFAPDGPYRWGMLGGALLVLLVVVAAGLPQRRRPAPLSAVAMPRWSAVAASLAVALLLVGAWGLALLLVALPVVLAARHRAWAPWVVAAPVLLAGVLQAAVAPGRLGDPWLEASLRLLCVLGLVLALGLIGFGGARVPSGVVRRSAR